MRKDLKHLSVDDMEMQDELEKARPEFKAYVPMMDDDVQVRLAWTKPF